jgi:TonB-dependent starch-binding outer membrane protein SusC
MHQEDEMTSKRLAHSALCVILLGACGPPGLPPAGPAPGEVDVGRGTQPEGKVTGAVGSVEDKNLSRSGPYRIEELLKGKLAGLQVINQPNGDFAFRVRGGNLSMMGDTAQYALVLVDGVPTTPSTIRASLSGLTPEDIRQVTVLKDVASTSMYGIRGSAGVVLINTKRR